jgi:hypothetical protein
LGTGSGPGGTHEAIITFFRSHVFFHLDDFWRRRTTHDRIGRGNDGATPAWGRRDTETIVLEREFIRAS